MNEKSATFEKSDNNALVSLVSCLRNESNLYTRLYWVVFLMQLGLSGILLISLGLLFRFYGYFSMSFIGLVGAVCVLQLYRAGRIYDLHIENFNESCDRLESHLPNDLQAYAVMHTYSERIKPKLQPYNPRKLFLFTTLFLLLFWLATLIGSGYEAFRAQYPRSSEKYQEVLPFTKKK